MYCALKDATCEGEDNFYIDVGANDPIIDSVTKFFYDRGWHGINIEPIPNKCALLAESRPRDINLCIGLSNKQEKLPLIVVEPADGRSTFSTQAEEKSHLLFKDNLIYPKILKKMLTLSDIYERYCQSHSNIHFCKIDVESFEKEVLEGIKDWNKFRPWIFVLEFGLPTSESHLEWEPILEKNDYIPVFEFGVNRYFVDSEREYLLRGFKQINQFIAQNEIVKMVMQRISFK